MKIVNPMGRTPNNEEMTAYGCVCNSAANNHDTVMGNVPCNVCAYSCNSSSANSSANQAISTNRMTTY